MTRNFQTYALAPLLVFALTIGANVWSAFGQDAKSPAKTPGENPAVPAGQDRVNNILNQLLEIEPVRRRAIVRSQLKTLVAPADVRKVMLAEKDALRKSRILLILGDLNDASLEAEAIKMLPTSDVQIAKNAIEYLQQFGTVKAVAPLESAAANGKAGNQIRLDAARTVLLILSPNEGPARYDTLYAKIGVKKSGPSLSKLARGFADRDTSGAYTVGELDTGDIEWAARYVLRHSTPKTAAAVRNRLTFVFNEQLKKQPRPLAHLYALRDASQTSAAPLPYTEPGTGIVFPVKMAGLARGGYKEYPDKRLGTAIEYYDRANRMKVSIYIYNMGHANIADGVKSKGLADHFEQCKGDIDAAVKKGSYHKVTRLGDKIIPMGAGPNAHQILRGQFDLEVTPGDVRTSLLYLTGFNKQYLKLRPVVFNQRVYIADARGRIQALDATNGTRIWSVDADAQITGGPGFGENTVLVGTSEAETIAYRADDGSELWRATVSSEILSAPQKARNTVIVRTGDGKIFGLSGNTGRRLWIYDRTVPSLTLRGTSRPVIAGNLVIAGFDGGRMAALEVRTGKLTWEAPVATARGRSPRTSGPPTAARASPRRRATSTSSC